MRSDAETYRLVVGLSILSAALGLARELFVVRMLGLSATNDRLQLCLSITFTISLLGEPVRLASLNTLRHRLERSRLAVLGGLIVAVSIGLAVFFGSQFDAPTGWWIPAATVAGVANLTYSAVLPRFQQRGRLVAVHAVSVLPNLLLFIGLVAFAGWFHTAVDSTVIVLTLAAPLSQLTVLSLLRRDLLPEPPVEGPPVRWRQLGAHLGAAVGLQLAQGGVRTRLGLAPAGSLALFVLIARAGETLRAILVDTFIAVRLRRWVAAGPLAVSRRPRPPWAVGWIALSLLWAVVAAPPLAAMIVAFVGVGAVISAIVRIRYHRLNAAGQPRRLAGRVAVTELILGAGSMACSLAVWGGAWLVVWIVYVLRPTALERLTGDPRLAVVEV